MTDFLPTPLSASYDLAQQLHDFQMSLVGRVEMLAAAYAKETHIPATECELVVITEMDKISYHFEVRPRSIVPLVCTCGTHAYIFVLGNGNSICSYCGAPKYGSIS